MRSTFVSVSLGLALVASLERGADAGNILVFGDSASRAEAQDRLNEAGHFVTIYGALPADLSNYDAIWHVGVGTSFDDSTRNKIAEFLKLGGGVYLSGEFSCCETMNASVQALVNRLVRSSASAPSTIQIGGLGTATTTQSFNADALGDVTLAPNELTEWRPGTGGRIAGVRDENVLSKDVDGFITGAVWGGDDLITGGQMVIMMDTDWYNRTGALEIADNVARFLIEGVEIEPTPPVTPTKPELDSPAGTAARDATFVVRHEIASEELGDDELEVGGCSAGGGAGRGLGLLGILGALAFVNRKRRR
jgi:hypothetical protein